MERVDNKGGKGRRRSSGNPKTTPSKGAAGAGASDMGSAAREHAPSSRIKPTRQPRPIPEQPKGPPSHTAVQEKKGGKGKGRTAKGAASTDGTIEGRGRRQSSGGHQNVSGNGTGNGSRGAPGNGNFRVAMAAVEAQGSSVSSRSRNQQRKSTGGIRGPEQKTVPAEAPKAGAVSDEETTMAALAALLKDGHPEAQSLCDEFMTSPDVAYFHAKISALSAATTTDGTADDGTPIAESGKIYCEFGEASSIDDRLQEHTSKDESSSMAASSLSPPQSSVSELCDVVGRLLNLQAPPPPPLADQQASLVRPSAASSLLVSGCPWCATMTAPELLGWLRSEVTEVALELDSVNSMRTAPFSLSSHISNGNATTTLSVSPSPSPPPPSLALVDAAKERLDAEIGDLLFNLVLLAGLCDRDYRHSTNAANNETTTTTITVDGCGGGSSSLERAAAAAAAKVKRRCTYVFGDELAPTRAAAEAIWQRVKREEKAKAAQAAQAEDANGCDVDSDELGSNCAAWGDAVVLFTKWPSAPAQPPLGDDQGSGSAAAAGAGAVKTRLAAHPSIGRKGASELATAMVKDALVTMGTAPQLKKAAKVVLFAPSDAGPLFEGLLSSLHLDPADFTLLPMLAPETTVLAEEATAAAASASPGGGNDEEVKVAGGAAHLRSADLGQKLSAGIDAVRRLSIDHDDHSGGGGGSGGGGSGEHGNGGVSAPMKKVRCGVSGAVAVLGMDAPELTGHTVGKALSEARKNAAAFLCPATDGGYALVALPPGASSKVFSGVAWSCPSTLHSQVTALATRGVPSLIGDTFQDMDDAADVLALHTRCLTPTSAAAPPLCPHTSKALARLFGPAPLCPAVFATTAAAAPTSPVAASAATMTEPPAGMVSASTSTEDAAVPGHATSTTNSQSSSSSSSSSTGGGEGGGGATSEDIFNVGVLCAAAGVAVGAVAVVLMTRPWKFGR